MRKQKGFTVIELLVVIGFFLSIGVIGGMCYVAWHFIVKFW